MSAENAPGPTGEFPQGKLNEADRGALRVAVSHGDGKVKVDFGTRVAWLAMDPDEALQFAMVLIDHALVVMRGGEGK